MKNKNTTLTGKFVISLFLLFAFWHNNVTAQESKYKGARTWKIISSLMGTSLENTKTILKNNGMILQKNEAVKEMGLDIYNFNTPEANELEFTVGFKENKVAMFMIPFEYSNKKDIYLEKDLSEFKKQLKLDGYELADEKVKKHGGAFDVTWSTIMYFFKKSNQTKEVRIFHDTSMSMFALSFGEKKYLDLIEMD